MLSYPVKLKKDTNDTLLVDSPDFPELHTFGENKEDALRHAVGAFEEVIAARIHHREDVPQPSPGRTRVKLSTLSALKVLLYREMRKQGINHAALARRLGRHLNHIQRLLDLNHASRLDQMDAAFKALQAEVEVNVRLTA